MLEAEEETEVGRDPRGTYGLVRNLVRYALACEFGRVPIKREGIREKGTLGTIVLEVLC